MFENRVVEKKCFLRDNDLLRTDAWARCVDRGHQLKPIPK